MSTNQGEAVARAKRKVTECQKALQSAQLTLGRTSSSHNLAATRAVESAKRALSQAESELTEAQANQR